LNTQVDPATWKSLWLWLWICPVIPIAQFTLAPLTRRALDGLGPGKLSLGHWAGALALSVFAFCSAPLLLIPYLRYYLLVPTLCTLEGLSFRQALLRSPRLLDNRMGTVAVLLATWVGLTGLLCLLLGSCVEGALPWVLGLLDIRLNGLAWLGVALRAAVLTLFLPGFQIALGLFCRRVSQYSEGKGFLDALDQAYPP
jgi:hypothetical protein